MSIATNIIEAIASGDFHDNEDPSYYPSRHLHKFVAEDGKLCCFLRELARYIDAEEKKYTTTTEKK